MSFFMSCLYFFRSKRPNIYGFLLLLGETLTTKATIRCSKPFFVLPLKINQACLNKPNPGPNCTSRNVTLYHYNQNGTCTPFKATSCDITSDYFETERDCYIGCRTLRMRIGTFGALGNAIIELNNFN